MIYATHKLYDCKHCVTTYQVVETKDGCLSKIYGFECEKHSMQWYDAIVLSTKSVKGKYFGTFDEIIEYLDGDSEGFSFYVYGVTYDAGGCLLSPLK